MSTLDYKRKVIFVCTVRLCFLRLGPDKRFGVKYIWKFSGTPSIWAGVGPWWWLWQEEILSQSSRGRDVSWNASCMFQPWHESLYPPCRCSHSGNGQNTFVLMFSHFAKGAAAWAARFPFKTIHACCSSMSFNIRVNIRDSRINC